MLHKYVLILSLICGTACGQLDLFDEPTPWAPLKKEHALFYSAVWTAIGGSLGYGIYLLGKTLKKPTDSHALMNDVICGITMAIFAKLVHHSANEVVEAMQLYFKQSDQIQNA